MQKIYKYTHKQITTRSILLALPAFLLIVAAPLWMFIDISLARWYLNLHLKMPAFLQLLVWLVLPIYSGWKARKAFKYGTVKRYRKWNVLALFMSISTLLLFTIIIGISVIQ